MDNRTSFSWNYQHRFLVTVLILSILSIGSQRGVCATQDQRTVPISTTQASSSEPEVRTQINPTGGYVELPGIVTIQFPSGVFKHQQLISIKVIQNPTDAALFAQSTADYGVTAGMTYQIQINTGSEPPQHPISVQVIMADDFRGKLPQNSWVRLFGYSKLSDDDLEMELFEHCGGRFRPKERVVNVALIPSFFSTVRSKNNTYEAVITLGASTPK